MAKGKKKKRKGRGGKYLEEKISRLKSQKILILSCHIEQSSAINRYSQSTRCEEPLYFCYIPFSVCLIFHISGLMQINYIKNVSKRMLWKLPALSAI